MSSTAAQRDSAEVAQSTTTEPANNSGARPGSSSGQPTTTERPTTTAEDQTDSTTEVPASTPASDDGGDGVPVPIVGVSIVAALLIGLAIGWFMTRGSRRDPGATTRPDELAAARRQAAGEAAGRQQAEGLYAAERARSHGLAETLFEVGDRSPNPAVADRIATGLGAAGWERIDPTGLPFDPDRMQSVDRVATDAPALDRTVAEVERFGYLDPAGNLARLPEVVVFRFDGAASDGAIR